MPATITTVPSNATQPGITGDCKAWYLTTPGDTCDLIVQVFGTFSLSSFLSWNPALGGIGCSGLTSGNYYCIASKMIELPSP